MKSIEVYSRPGCHLCEQLIEELLPLVRGRLELVVHDVDSREDWRLEYNINIPVVKYDGELVCQYYLEREALDEFSLRSHQRAAADMDGAQRDIVPIDVAQADGSVLRIAADEGIRPNTSLEKLAGLSAAFVDDAIAQRFPEITAWGVTPQAQKTGTSPGRTVTASPQSGRPRSAIPSTDASP